MWVSLSTVVVLVSRVNVDRLLAVYIHLEVVANLGKHLARHLDHHVRQEVLPDRFGLDTPVLDEAVLDNVVLDILALVPD